jgi:hypothetical protein
VAVKSLDKYHVNDYIRGMHRITIIWILLLASCTPLSRATFKAEEAHHALYKQKALVVSDVTHNKVQLTNPACTRCYFLKGKQYVNKWETGDTMVIDSNLTDFYHIRYARCQ